jgi:hypothetical protein
VDRCFCQNFAQKTRNCGLVSQILKTGGKGTTQGKDPLFLPRLLLLPCFWDLRNLMRNLRMVFGFSLRPLRLIDVGNRIIPGTAWLRNFDGADGQ